MLQKATATVAAPVFAGCTEPFEGGIPPCMQWEDNLEFAPVLKPR